MTDPDSREDRLEQFLDSHDALTEDRHRAVFLLGGLVGRITAYQDYNDISSTLVRRYPVDYLTKQTVKEVTKEVLQMDNSYAEADAERSYLTNNRYTSRLADTMLRTDPASWSMTEAELQWLYSLGISYGLNDSNIEQPAEDTEDVAEIAND
jgi:CRISPR-associated protein Cas8b/Csh1 subtype I-B